MIENDTFIPSVRRSWFNNSVFMKIKQQQQQQKVDRIYGTNEQTLKFVL